MAATLDLSLMGLTKPGIEWWHMKAYTDTPNTAGAVEKLAIAGLPWVAVLSAILMLDKVTMVMKAVHLMTVVKTCRYLVLDTLKNAKGPRRRRNTAT